MKYVLGLDLGPSSIGWAAIDIDDNGNYKGLSQMPDGPNNIPAIGVRIFPAGVDNINQGQREESKNKKRREARSIRRMLRRRRARRLKLLSVLTANGLMPTQEEEQQKEKNKNPYELRAKALINKISLYEIGRIFLHIAKRRGFQSNRRQTEKDTEAGLVKEAIERLGQEIGSKTLGQFWAEKYKENPFESIRNRRGNYRWIAQRGQYHNELDQIWKTQSGFYPVVLIDGLKKLLFEIIFKQIDFELSNTKKRKVIGTCTLIAGKPRLPLSSRKAQEFRLLQKINDMKVYRKGKEIEFDRHKLHEELMTSKERNFEQIRKLLNLNEGDMINHEQIKKTSRRKVYKTLASDKCFGKTAWKALEGKQKDSIWKEIQQSLLDKNTTIEQIAAKIESKHNLKIKDVRTLEALKKPKSNKLLGNQIDATLASNKFFSEKAWIALSEQQKEAVWVMFQNYVRNSNITPEQLAEKVKNEYGLEIRDITSLENLSEPKGNINFCETAIDKLLPYMRDGKNLYEAIEKANFARGWTQQKFLPSPSRNNGISIPNPIVTTVMFQLRKVVNALIRELGKPEKIVIEFARELKANKEDRESMIEERDDNQEEWERCAERIREYYRWDENVEVSGTDKLKYRLWEQQNELCLYSLRKIGIEQLLSTGTEIDHILPYSMSLDNSMNNKVVCFANENQAKGQNSPIDWIGETSERFRKIVEVMERGTFDFDRAKKERFFVHNEEIAEKYTPERLLQDTSYIAREVRSYLKRLYSASEAEKRIKTTKGGITAELRNIWGLNAILRDGELGPKNRDDLRHHAVDASVIAITDPGMIKKITDKLKNQWPRRPSHTPIDEPWNNFGLELAKAVEKINVSHKVLRKVKGALHEETNYWKETNGLHAGKYITRKELNIKFTSDWADKICDEEIKKLVIRRLTQYEQDAKKAFAEPLYLANKEGKQTPVRKVRVWQRSSNMMQLKPNIWVEPGANHHIEIFETNDKKGNTKQDGVIVTTFEAYRRNLSGQPIIQTKQESGNNFIMSLSQNEMILLKLDDGSEILHRTQKMSQSKKKKDIIFRPHNYGGKTSDYDKPPLIQRRSPSSLIGRKVIVDPLGRIRRAND